KPPVPASEVVKEDILNSPQVKNLTCAQLDLNLWSESALSSDLEYTGGVNYHPDTNWQCGAVSVCPDSNDESLCKLEGNEFNSNLAALQLIEAEKIKSEWNEVLRWLHKLLIPKLVILCLLKT
ncbi:hypothetical protein V8B97DRAFT_1877292, partial [Scleroderma yunnanense]